MKKKIFIFVIIILILINLCYIYISVSDNKKSYLILDCQNVWKYNGEKIKKLSKKELKKLSFSDVIKYGNETEKGYYDFSTRRFYDSNYERKYFKVSDVIVKGPLKIKNYSYNISSNLTEDDKEEISNFLLENGKEFDLEKLYINKATLNGGVLYFVTPYAGTDIINYSLIFVVDKSGSTKVIYNKSISENGNPRLSSLNKIIDLDNDGQEEIILISDIKGSAGNECYSLYKYDSDVQNYKNIIDCEE